MLPVGLMLLKPTRHGNITWDAKRDSRQPYFPSLMGESDIIDIDPAAHDGNAHPRLMGLDEADRINLLGHWLDR